MILSVIMLSVACFTIMLNVLMLSVFMLNAEAPLHRVRVKQRIYFPLVSTLLPTYPDLT
jgi:hypothetical protein